MYKYPSVHIPVWTVTSDGARRKSVFSHFFLRYTRISMCLLVLPEVGLTLTGHLVLLIWSSTELVRCVSSIAPSQLTHGAAFDRITWNTFANCCPLGYLGDNIAIGALAGIRYIRDVSPVVVFPVGVATECWVCYALLMDLTSKTLDAE